MSSMGATEMPIMRAREMQNSRRQRFSRRKRSCKTFNAVACTQQHCPLMLEGSLWTVEHGAHASWRVLQSA